MNIAIWSPLTGVGEPKILSKLTPIDGYVINETKATPRLNYINDFIEVMANIHGYFPEYQGKTIIPIFAGLFIPDNLLRYLTKHKIYALGMREDTMELLNFELLAELG